MLKMTTTLQKWGNSQGVRLPKEILKAALFSEKETVELFADETGIKIQKAHHFETLDDLFKNYEGTCNCEEINTGKPVGNEVW